MIEILILSFIQGVAEFLPVSSSSHLIIISKFINFENQSLYIDVSLHIGSFIAVIVYFHKDIFNFFKNKELLLKIIISSVPVISVGYFLVETNLIEKLRRLEIVGWTTLIFGILLYISDKFETNKNIVDDFDYKSAFIIGLFQTFSLIPGVSRAGITITAGRLLKFNRFEASKISFLLSIPTLGAVSIYGLSNTVSMENIEFSNLNFISILYSFIFSFLTIKYFLKYISKYSMTIFVLYRLILGGFLISFVYL